MANIHKCNECRNEVKRDEGLECAGLCKSIFHLRCIGVSPRDLKILKSVEGCNWFCSTCRLYFNFFDRLSKDISDFKESVLSELLKVNEKISSANNKELCSPGTSMSYANVLKGEAIVIKPKSKQESSKTKEIVTQKLNPCTMEIGITQLKEVKDGGILIKCKTKEEIRKLKDEAERSLGNHFQVSIPEKKKPCVKVVDFEENISKEELKDCITKQNEYLRGENVEIKVLVIKKMVKRYMAILECDPATHEKILQEGSLSIGWVPACRVFDYVNVFRCYQCGGYGHNAKICKIVKVCAKCSSPDHSLHECANKSYKCRNCEDANNKLKLSLDTSHSMFDINRCTVYRKQFNIQKQKIQFNSQ